VKAARIAKPTAPVEARKSAIARSFDAAASTYDSHAPVQRRAARELAKRIANIQIPGRAKILEIGCGTGFLSTALCKRFGAANCLFTDLAPAMTRRCGVKLARRGKVSLAVMDGELPAVGPVFDLVASSFAFQWFFDLPSAISGLAACLRPGGSLAFATLGKESLAEWRELHDRAGLAFAGLTVPGHAELLQIAQRAGLVGSISEEKIKRRYRSALAFLQELKSLGATAPTGRAPGAAQLRSLLRQAEDGFTVTYHVLYACLAAPGAVGPGVFGSGAE